MFNRLSWAIGCLAICLSIAASAQPYPSKPINLIVPFPAGAGSDVVARILATELQASLGQPVIVQNRPGANTAIGAAAVASAPPDGYTLLLATASTAALPAVNKSLSFDPMKDFTPISRLTDFVINLYVNAELPVKTVPELIAYVHANPGKVFYATGNVGGIVSSAQFLSMAKLDMVSVPYKGEPAAVTDLVANRVHVMFASPTATEAFVKQGKLRVLATVLPQRSAFAPDVPSLSEYLPKYAVTGWGGLMGPAGMPRDINARLAREVAVIFGRADVKKKLETLQMVAHTSTPEEFNAFFRGEVELYGRVLREAGVKPE